MRDRKAVALKYFEDLPAPFIAASGRGYLADKMREIARKEGIPIRQDENLSEFLFSMDVGSFIPEELYQVIAELYTFVVQMQGDYEKH